MRPPPATHPAVRELKTLALRIENDGVATDLVKWILEHVGHAECESLIDKDAATRLAKGPIQEILKHQAKRRELELGRMIVQDAGITEDFDVGYAVGRRTTVWVIR